jgi:hypothetical protein
MLFDAYNPWARLIELNSTHPLTGKRISHLEHIAKEKRQDFAAYDMEAAAKRVHLDTGRLWRKFWGELGLLLAPVGAALVVGLAGAWFYAPAAAAIAVLATLPLRYPSGAAPGATVVELMSDPAASPVVGRLARLEGKAIGRVNPGFIGGEDVVYQDRSGLLAVDFRSMLGLLGDLFAGWARVPKHLGQPGNVTGWFRRSMGGYLVLKELTSTNGRLRARPFFWQAALCLVVIAATGFLAVTGEAKHLWQSHIGEPFASPDGVEAEPQSE